MRSPVKPGMTVNPDCRCKKYDFDWNINFVQLGDSDLFSEAEEGVTDFDERHNPRLAEDVAMNAYGIGKLNLFNFKVDKKTGKQK